MRRADAQGSRSRFAWKALAGIMLVNGALAVVAPRFLTRRLGVKPEMQPGMRYVFRMFGIRTLFIAIDLIRRPQDRKRALQEGIVVHATDAGAALTAGIFGQLPFRHALMVAGISIANTYLAISGARSESDASANADGPYKPSLPYRVLASVGYKIDRSIGWSMLPPLPGALVLEGIRVRLRESNLYDTSTLPAVKPPAVPTKPNGYLGSRSADGSYNDLNVSEMGRAGTRFGRNVPNPATQRPNDEALLTPNPRLVSLQLLSRDKFIPATTLNLLAAAWLQFNVHDWLSHGKNSKPDVQKPWEIELAASDPWKHQRPMTILRTRHDPTSSPHAEPRTFINIASSWWDASQLYGSDEKTQRQVRAGVEGKLNLGSNGLLPVDPKTGVEITGVSGNWWLGLDLMHTLFTLEHNAICDRLRKAYPNWSDQELFDRARLINAALIAKIHTVEWTPGILGHPTLQLAMRANWWGLAGEAIYRKFGRISRSELISGIPGSPTNHFGIPYSITEEFVAVYRMHPLIRDDYEFRNAWDSQPMGERKFTEVAFKNARKALESVGMENALYSFGLMNPGAITLHNFPKAMQQIEEPDGTIADLAATDILRVRERGVPRYNAFRQFLHKAPVKSFEELSDNPRWVQEIRDVYNNDLDAVDLIVGLFAEPVPTGFGFSDTAFRIFVLMASRRLNSDRFFTTHFTPEVYTPVGMQWLNDNGFASVVLRHFPQLEPAVRGIRNPFAPWNAVRR